MRPRLRGAMFARARGWNWRSVTCEAAILRDPGSTGTTTRQRLSSGASISQRTVTSLSGPTVLPPCVAPRVEHSPAAARQSASGHTVRVSARASHYRQIRRMSDHGTNEPLFEVGSRVTVHGHDGAVFSATVVGYPAVGFEASVFVDDGASMVRTASQCPACSVPSPAPTVSRCWCHCVMSLLGPPQHLLSMSPPQQAAPEA